MLPLRGMKARLLLALLLYCHFSITVILYSKLNFLAPLFYNSTQQYFTVVSLILINLFTYLSLSVVLMDTNNKLRLPLHFFLSSALLVI